MEDENKKTKNVKKGQGQRLDERIKEFRVYYSKHFTWEQFERDNKVDYKKNFSGLNGRVRTFTHIADAEKFELKLKKEAEIPVHSLEGYDKVDLCHVWC